MRQSFLHLFSTFSPRIEADSFGPPIERNGSLPGRERRVDKIDIALAFGLCSVGIQCTERQIFLPSRQAIDGKTLFSKERNMQKIWEGRGPPALSGDAFPNHRNRGEKANHERGKVPWRYSPTP